MAPYTIARIADNRNITPITQCNCVIIERIKTFWKGRVFGVNWIFYDYFPKKAVITPKIGPDTPSNICKRLAKIQNNHTP